jgi:hypothetical protein
MSRVVTIILIAALAGCDAGNYSNEDLDFQLAVPAREDIAVRLPAQALETTDSSEAYRNTRKTVRDLDGTAEAFLSLLDHVRINAPSERLPNKRIWGPFPIQESPLWLARLVVERFEEKDKPLHFSYSIEFRAKADSIGPWMPLFSGEFTPNASARRGTGILRFTSAGARAAGFPLGGLSPIDILSIEYKTDSFPLTVRVEVTPYPPAPTAVYVHTEEQDGSGFLHFVFPTANERVSLLEFRSRWLGSGAGRADVKVLAGGPLWLGLMGTECWGIDTRLVFRKLPWEPVLSAFGVESDCAFPAP